MPRSLRKLISTPHTHCKRCRYGYEFSCNRRAANKPCACCVDPHVRQIVGREHVGSSMLHVTRRVVAKIKGGRRAFLAATRKDRRLLIAMVMHQHNANRHEYRAVMGGM